MSLEKGYYPTPRWTYEYPDCSLPVTFDTYSNCAFGCVYCFAQYRRGMGEGKYNYKAKKVKAINVDKLKKLFNGEIPDSQFYKWISEGRPIQWGGNVRSI